MYHNYPLALMKGKVGARGGGGGVVHHTDHSYYKIDHLGFSSSLLSLHEDDSLVFSKHTFCRNFQMNDQ